MLTCDLSLSAVSDFNCSRRRDISETKLCFSRFHAAVTPSSGANGLLVLRWWPGSALFSGTDVRASPMDIGDSSRPTDDVNGFSAIVV